MLYFMLGFLTLNIHLVRSVLPQVRQEGLLRPYKSYADVTLFHYYVPKEVTLATFEFAAFMDSPSCHPRSVFIYLQQGSYPVMSGDNASFPYYLYTKRTSMHNITLHSSYQPHNATVLKVYYPLPGSWFATGYLPDWNQQVQQEGLGHKCQYSLGSIAVWTQLSKVELVPIQTTSKFESLDHYTYYKFFIPSGTWEFTLEVNNCKYLTMRRPYDIISEENGNRTTKKLPRSINTFSKCIEKVLIEPRKLPNNLNPPLDTPVNTIYNNSFTYTQILPFTDSYYYVLIVAETRVSYNISIRTQYCPNESEMYGKSYIQRFPGFGGPFTSEKERAVRINASGTYSAIESNTTRKCNCVPIFHLTRFKHPQDFSDTFLLESKEWFTSWLGLSDAWPIGVSFEILQYIDIGGTLSITLHLDEMLMKGSSETLVVRGCIRKARPPHTLCEKNYSEASCEKGLSLFLSSNSSLTLDDTLSIPYPEPDLWFISFTTSCFSSNGSLIPCPVPEVLISIDVRTTPCVLARDLLTKQKSESGTILPCGNYGICQEVHKGQFFYTTCRCIGGYKGWDCSDDSEAESDSLLLLTTLLLTLSNAFFMPAIYLALRRKMFTQATVYLATMLSSTLYHACDQDLYSYCLTRYQVLQFCDFFCSILSFWVTLIALAKCSPKYESPLYVFGSIVIAIGVEYNRTGLLVFIVPFTLGVGIPISLWTYRSIQKRSIIKPKLTTVFLFIPGLLLGASGLILFAFVETERNYLYTHSAWHAIIAISLLYLLPKTSERKRACWSHAQTSEQGQLNISNSAELSSVRQSTYAPLEAQTPPVFFITSELDHLVH